jgi:hypothetical protein
VAFKNRVKPNYDYNRLRNILVNSGFQNENSALFQTINGLIDGAGSITDIVDGKLGKGDKINAKNQISGKIPLENGGTQTGLYIPELTLVSNLSGAGTDPAYYYRIGDFIHVAGIIFALPNAFNTTTQLGIALPLISYFDFDHQCSGVAVCPTVRSECAAIFGDVVNNRAQMEWICGFNGVQHRFFFNLTYRVIQK